MNEITRDSKEYKDAFEKTKQILKSAGMQIMGEDTDTIWFKQADENVVFLQITKIEKEFISADLCKLCARVPGNCYLAKKLPVTCKWFITPESAVCRKCGKRFIPRGNDEQEICLCDEHLAIFSHFAEYRSRFSPGMIWTRKEQKHHDAVDEVVNRWMRETR